MGWTGTVMLLVLRVMQGRRLRVGMVCRRRVEQALRPLKSQTRVGLRLERVLDVLRHNGAHWGSRTMGEMSNRAGRGVHWPMSQGDRCRDVIQTDWGVRSSWAAGETRARRCGIRRMSLSDGKSPWVGMGSVEAWSTCVNRIAGDTRTCRGSVGGSMVQLVKWDPVPCA